MLPLTPRAHIVKLELRGRLELPIRCLQGSRSAPELPELFGADSESRTHVSGLEDHGTAAIPCPLKAKAPGVIRGLVEYYSPGYINVPPAVVAAGVGVGDGVK